NNIISLKLWLIYALSEKNQLNWTFNKAQEHRRQMLEILKNLLTMSMIKLKALSFHKFSSLIFAFYLAKILF
ncbi:hypothetical protein ACM14P_001939, partial [Campylobacter coli]